MTNDILCSPIQFYHFIQHSWQTYRYFNVTATMILQIHLSCGLMKYAIFQRIKFVPFRIRPIESDCPPAIWICSRFLLESSSVSRGGGNGVL